MISLNKIKDKPLDTSKVIMEVSKDKTFTYYLPGFMRLNVKNFTNINLQNLDAEMNAAIIFSVYYGALPQHLIDQLETGIKLNFQRDQTIRLTQKEDHNIQAKRVKQANTVHFYVKKLFHLRIQSDVFWSPFEIIHTIFTITIQSIVIGDTVIQINLMNHPNKIQKLFTSELDTFGNYALAVAYTEAQYSNRGVKKAKQFNYASKGDVKISTQDIIIQIIDGCGEFLIAENMGCYRHAHFDVPLYKMPIFPLSTIFIPLWLLGIINLGVFFISQDLGNRIQGISGLMIAFAALIPTIRNQIPPHPGWILIQVLVYLEAGTSLLALFHSIAIRNQTNFDLDWSQSVLFIIAAAVTILTFAYVVVMVIIHYTIWKPKYTRLQITQQQRNARLANIRTNLAMDEEKKRSMKIIKMRQNVMNNRNSLIKFIRTEWKNEQCDQCFQQIQRIEPQSVFMQLQEPQMHPYNPHYVQAHQLSPQQRRKTVMKNVSMNVQLDDQMSDSAKGTLNSIRV